MSLLHLNEGFLQNLFVVSQNYKQTSLSQSQFYFLLHLHVPHSLSAIQFELLKNFSSLALNCQINRCSSSYSSPSSFHLHNPSQDFGALSPSKSWRTLRLLTDQQASKCLLSCGFNLDVHHSLQVSPPKLNDNVRRRSRSIIYASSQNMRSARNPLLLQLLLFTLLIPIIGPRLLGKASN